MTREAARRVLDSITRAEEIRQRARDAATRAALDAEDARAQEVIEPEGEEQ